MKHDTIELTERVETFDWEVLADADAEFQLWCAQHAQDAIEAIEQQPDDFFPTDAALHAA